MRTTTTIWRLFEDPATASEESRAIFQTNKSNLQNAAAELAGELYRNELSVEISQDRATATIKRAWPDLATAEAWVALCIRENGTNLRNGLISAQVDPE